MNVKSSTALVACLALFVSACGSSPQRLILGKWQVESAQVGSDTGSPAEIGSTNKLTAEFSRNGTAKLTMLGQTLQGTYRLNAENELEWTMNGITTKSLAKVTATELELTDDANRTIRYKRQ